jgi:hypothetical protein
LLEKCFAAQIKKRPTLLSSLRPVRVAGETLLQLVRSEKALVADAGQRRVGLGNGRGKESKGRVAICLGKSRTAEALDAVVCERREGWRRVTVWTTHRGGISMEYNYEKWRRTTREAGIPYCA